MSRRIVERYLAPSSYSLLERMKSYSNYVSQNGAELKGPVTDAGFQYVKEKEAHWVYFHSGWIYDEKDKNVFDT